MTENAPHSDTETAEKPVREQLRNASIAGLPADAQVKAGEGATAAEGTNGERVETRGRLQRKRSFEEVEAGQPEETPSTVAKSHTRKRSRDSTVEEDELNNGQRKTSGERPRETGDPAAPPSGEVNGNSEAIPDERASTPEHAEEKRTEAAPDAMASPKNKRSRIHSTTVEDAKVLAQEPSASASAPGEVLTRVADKVPESTTEPDAPTTIVSPTSGFANTSAVSPFGALAGRKSPPAETPKTSSSAFASSGFGSLAGSATSGFGAIGKTSDGFGAGGGFGTGGKSPLATTEASKENGKPQEVASSTFGGALGQKSAFAAAAPSAGSGFGSGVSAFSSLGKGFGSSAGGFGGVGGSGGLTSFASGKPSTALAGSSKPAKAFGAPPAEDDDNADEGGEEDEAGLKSPSHHDEEEKQDERFYEQALETGEEDEVTEYSCRAKLYNFAAVQDGKKEWRERGIGVLRFNVKQGGTEGEGSGKPKARLLMRADGSHRVVLNTPVKKEIKFGSPAGGAPQGGFMCFMGTIDGKEKLELLQLKVRRVTNLGVGVKATDVHRR